MNAHGTAGRLLVGLAVVVMLGGCAAGASPTPLPGSAAPASLPTAAVATPASTPAPPSTTPAAIAYGPVTVVAGTDTCPGLNPDWMRDPDGTWHVRDLTVKCTDKTDDPRVSGTHTAIWSADAWGDAAEGVGAAVQWGTVRLENAGGAWEGRLTGVASLPGRGDSIVIWYTGTGDYAGLAYFALLTGSDPWTIHGQVFPGDPPTPASAPPAAVAPSVPTTSAGPTTASSPAPTAISYGPVTVVAGTSDCPSIDFGTVTTDAAGVQHGRDGTMECIDTADDPRVSGSYTATWNLDWWGTTDQSEGALVQWATARIVNADGTWEGRATGVYSTDRGDTIASWFTGTGAYAGLTYFELLTGRGPWKIEGQVFPGSPPTP